ncbi:hypothetical protein POJ06DRAFT_13530 [Lipomyces tetrasporus]|uniref:Uncharacterized protein n=1 Tax=Lipomyces tetrasporus TaxID=54092 RepID=A0AAD7QZ52_9ASCO|nr:uncharacterized protein POJ06DRAFT_13530 [Lipomyces tetrasporus]KAJ8104134.1 hypothetical protein POJ06DRAFT_13530 [Lipomyces tetrasporus]
MLSASAPSPTALFKDDQRQKPQKRQQTYQDLTPTITSASGQQRRSGQHHGGRQSPLKQIRISGDESTPTEGVLVDIAQTSSADQQRPAKRFKSLSQIASEVDAYDPTEPDEDMEILHIRPTPVRSANLHSDLDRLLSGTAEMSLEKESEIEELRVALLWKLNQVKNEIDELEHMIFAAEHNSQLESESAKSTTVELDALVRGLLSSNENSISDLRIPDSSNLAKSESLLPHMPEPELDLENLQRITGLTIRSLGTELSFLPSTDSENAIVRTARHRIQVTHSDTQISLTLSLMVNQTDLEVLEFFVPQESIQPLWARGTIMEWTARMIGDGPEDLRQYDISCFLYGVAEFARMANIRAETLARIARTFPSYISNVTVRQKEYDNDDEKGDINKELTDEEKGLWLGETRIVIRLDSDSNGLQLVVAWELVLDGVTGDVGSRVTAHISAPRYYEDIDHDEILGRIPEIFNTLVRTRGVYRATRIIVRNWFEEV